MFGSDYVPMIFLGPDGNIYQQLVYCPQNSTPSLVQKQEQPFQQTEDTNEKETQKLNQVTPLPKHLADRLKPIGKPAQKNQNPKRNVLTNISSQLFVFLLCKKKSARVLDFIKPDRTEEWETEFYTFVKRVKSGFSGYYNYQKMKQLWFGKTKNEIDHEKYKILRILSQYYIRHRLINSLITSKKMSEDLKEAHLKARRILMALLRDPTIDLPLIRVSDS